MLREVVNVTIVVEFEVIRVAVPLEERYNPLLLLWRKQLLAVMVAVVFSMAAKKGFYLVTQWSVVLALHLLEYCIETIGGMNLADSLEV